MGRHPNPNAPAYALCTDQVVPGLAVVVRRPTHATTPSKYLTILSKPFLQPWKEGRDILVVEVGMEDGTRRTLALAAMGMLRYPDGRWSRNYTILAT